jgi:hypothetical protein
MKKAKFKDKQRVKILSCNESSEFYKGKIGTVDGDLTNWDCGTFYYNISFDKYCPDSQDSDDDTPYFTECELEVA